MDKNSSISNVPTKYYPACAEDVEKSAIRDLIIQYIDALLKLAIEKGEPINQSIENAENFEDFSKNLFSGLNRTDVVMYGIRILYTTDTARANTRMRQYFEHVQKIPDIQDRLRRCYSMLYCITGMVFPMHSFPMWCA